MVEDQNQLLLSVTLSEKRAELYNSQFKRKQVLEYVKIDLNKSAGENLKDLAAAALSSDFPLAYTFIYGPIMLDLVARWADSKNQNNIGLVADRLGQVIAIYPETTSLCDYFFQTHHQHLNLILEMCGSQPETLLHEILLAYYRLLRHDRDRFAHFIAPNALYKVLQNELTNQAIKLLAVQVLSMYLNLAEQATIDLVEKHVPEDAEGTLAVYDGDLDVDYRFLELNEAQKLSQYHTLLRNYRPSQLATQKPIGKDFLTINPHDLSAHVVAIYGVIVPRINASSQRYEPNSKHEFVPTQEALSSIRALSRSIQLSKPVMLVGKAGSGKTFLINQLSKYTGAHETMVKIHLGEQTDAKLLLGTYTSGEKPGTFEWRAGVLTTAVKEGRWVLIEDIDKAPTEVISVLLTLLEQRQLSIPSRGETIKAANGFQLISTIRTPDDNHKDERAFKPDLIGIRLWDIVGLKEPDEKELKEILIFKFPALSHLIERFITSYNLVQSVYSNPQFISMNRGIHPRAVTVRDLVKFCSRVEAIFKNNNIQHSGELIPSHVYDSIFFEAADCFACAIGELSALKPIIETIGIALEIPASRINLYLSKHVPALEEDSALLKIGRAVLTKSRAKLVKKSMNTTSFARTNHSLRLMEQVGTAIQMCEPVLLVGETGTGKTTVVQHMAKVLNQKLTVINVSQQTESGDLLGGFKPVNTKTIAVPLLEDFESLFPATFSMKKNERFYTMLHKCFNKGQWKNVVKLLNEAYKLAKNLLMQQDDGVSPESQKKKRKLNSHDNKILMDRWSEFQQNVANFEAQYSSIENSFVFNFVEGSLVKAVRNGEWLLLDEVNLASSDTLESISDLLSEPSSRSVLLSEKGQAEPVKAHPDFRIFACMNPATDVGKRDLPVGVRSRFTEIYVHSPDRDITDLLAIIDKYIGVYSVSDEWVGNDVAELYLEAKKLAEANKLVDGTNQRPHFSIRTLTRTLIYVRDIVKIYGLRRSLYEGFCMSFLTLLNEKSEGLLRPLIEKFTLGRLKNPKSVISQSPACPGPEYVQFRHYWMKKGLHELQEQPHYIITPFVEKNMLNLVRATSGRRFPVLVQGPTSAGKTSMIKYLADITGHEFVRINNHEHTDLQEYLGTYMADETGKLSFREGVLVEALRKGHWIVLDELNLAPTDVLEALNRLLDDNRELFIPETQEVIHPHPDFMLFATQNPPGIYGGRKVLSRAFRNRFLELHFDDIPQDELEIILRERCKIAPSYAQKIVEVYRQLSVQRSAMRLFEQKNSFATLRDLFRWALRDAVGYENLAANGYMLLAERCRTTEEKDVVKAVLEKVMKVKVDMDNYYETLENANLQSMPSSIIWTKAMRRLAVLVTNCLKNNEPVLLVGETGCGKTTVCQLIAQFVGRQLITVNAHQNTETGDILGAQRPNRHRSDIQSELTDLLIKVLGLESDAYTVEELLQQYKKTEKASLEPADVEKVENLKDKLNVLFEWCDGPLVQALNSGDFFLLDEISLADDSVLERLNSVLEPERNLLLAEKGGSDSLVQAADGFQFFATMNPGGDYGKKELSPALRNRFTEIWVPSMEDFDDVRLIVSSKLLPQLSSLVEPIVQFSKWFGERFGGGTASNGVISLRDILSWVQFVNVTTERLQNKAASLVQGAAMVFIDTLGTNNTAYLSENAETLKAQKLDCLEVLEKFFGDDLRSHYLQPPSLTIEDQSVQVGMFVLDRGLTATKPKFNLNAPTTLSNLMRVARAMQVQKPILLEGSPGVGKTSLVSALAECTGNKLTRINLSEQTDLVDLFGSDAPGEKTGEFVWRDAPFLRAMQLGEWVLLDEMNLASQSVLEGLNACLDHRGEAYVPELDKAFTKHPNFTVFAAQNPQNQGGGRKGLPKSFVNRFSVVYVDVLSSEDLFLIAAHLYPDVDSKSCAQLIEIISTLEEEVSNQKLWGHAGSPWEFNLRDTLRWLKLLKSPTLAVGMGAVDYLDMILTQRFRTEEDRNKVRKIFERFFGKKEERPNYLQISPDYLQVNSEVVPRAPFVKHCPLKGLVPLQCNFKIYESVLRCVKQNWPLVLCGPTNSGKSEIIRYVSGILGTKVISFPMNSDTDSMDILGGYEQVDVNRKIAQAVERIVTTLRELIAINIGSEECGGDDAKVVALGLFHFISTNSMDASNLVSLLQLIENLKQFVDNETISQVFEDLHRIQDKQDQPSSVTFEWFDGLLLKAMEEGSWLVLENANLCSPSVLDRLNSLLETDGSLIINECSHEDGQPRVINPHPDFRLFLTVDPKFGELSRAMRNRSIEIYVDELSSRATLFDAANIEESELATSQSSQPDIIKEDSKRVDAIPLSRFIMADNSFASQFASLHDIASLSGFSVLESVISILPMSSFPKLKDWEKNALQARYYGDSRIISKFVNLAEYLQESGIFKQLATLSVEYEKLASNVLKNPVSFCRCQRLMPSVNAYVTRSLLENHPTIETSEPAYLFDIARLLSNFSSILGNATRRAQNARLSDLSYLELSAAQSQGRTMKKAPQIPIFEVLTLLREHIAERMTSADLFAIPGFYKSYFDLCSIWLGAFETSKAHDNAKLRAYQDLLESWQQETPLDDRLTLEVSSIANHLGGALLMDTGRSMTTIWNAFRQSQPSSKSAWDKLKKLLSVSDKFDDVAEKQFSDSYELITHLREIILGLRTGIISGEASDFDAVIFTLQKGVDQLDEISKRFLIQREHYFKSDFDSLLRLVCHQGCGTGHVVSRIASYTSLSTELLLNLKQESLSHPAVFDLLWKKNRGQFESFTASIFDSSILENIVAKVVSFKQISGCQMTQALEDAAVLQENLIESSQSITVDKVNLYRDSLFEWYRKIVSLHVEVKPLATLGEIQEAISTYEDPWFKGIHDQFLLAAVVSALESDSLTSLGKAWVLFSAGALQLFVPSTSFDPAINDYVLYDNYMTRQSLSEELLRSWECCRTVLSGDEPMTVEGSLKELRPTGPPAKPRVYRPQKAIDPLFEEWGALMKSTIGIEPVERLLTALERLDSLSEGQLNLFQQNSSQFMERLLSNYSVYSDLNDIFRGYILGLKFGFDVVKQGKIEQHKSTTLAPLWTIDLHILTSSQKLNDSYDQVQTLLKRATVESLSVERIATFYLKAFSFHSRDAQLSNTFESALQTLYYRWSMRRLRDEKEAQSKVGVYKFDDAEVDVESDFKRMFPDYQEVLSVENESAPKLSEETCLDDVYYNIARTYLTIFGDEAPVGLSDLINDGSSVSDALVQVGVTFKTCAPKPSNLTPALNQLAQLLSSFKSPKESANLDFYRESSLYETKRAVSVVEKVWVSTNSLLMQWPEHSTLNDLFRVCQEFMEYSGNTPIARLLQKIEQIFTIVTEWEKYASVAVSMQASLRELTDLVVSWRKLELRTWNSLFEYENLALNKSMGKWWFYLYETITLTVSKEESESGNDYDAIAKLLGSLNVFLSKCSYGEFSGRLALLKAFANHTKALTGPNSKITQALFNLLTFYHQFSAVIEVSLKDGRKKLEKDVSEVILLASWKDVNIDALKQSSHRSHNNLYKLVRKYRSLLSQNVSPIIESGLHGLARERFELEHFVASNKHQYVVSEINELVTKIASWESRPAPLKNLESSSRKMSSHCLLIEAEEYPHLKMFVDELSAEADRLRNETPKVYNKKDKKLLAALRVQKSKLLNDSLKELRRMGLKTGFREDIRKVQESVTSILSCVETFEGSPLEKCDSYFYRTLDLMPRLRFAISSPAADAPLVAIEKGLAVVENLLYFSITSRKTLRDFSDNFMRIKMLQENLDQVSRSTDPLLHQSLEITSEKFAYMCRWLPEILRYALETLNLTAPGPESKWLATIFSEGIEKVLQFKPLSPERQILDGGARNLLEDFNEFSLQLSNKLSSNGSSKTAFISRVVVEWINEQKLSHHLPDSTADAGSLEHIENTFRKVSTSIMLTIQHLVETRPEEITMEDDNWLVSSHKRVINVSKRVITSRVSSNLNDAVEMIKSLNFSKEQSRVILAVIKLSLPMVSRYFQLLVSLMNKMKVEYDSLSHGTFTLASILYNLGKNGFCSPTPPDEQTEDNNLQDGTGLGDGEGAQNNSKDVEEDEDLLENAQKPNEDQNKDEDQENDEDDAVDMEGDMAGDLENASGGDDDEHEEEEEGNEELDEEIDNLDEDDPNAIDEKMWNEESDDSKKEKQADEAPGNSADDDVQAAENEQDEKQADNQKPQDEEAEDAKHSNNEEDEEDQQSGSESDEENEATGQDDEVRNDEGTELETAVPEVETMDLPEDMNLDSGDDESGKSGSESEVEDVSGGEDEEETGEQGADGQTGADDESEEAEDGDEMPEDDADVDMMDGEEAEPETDENKSNEEEGDEKSDSEPNPVEENPETLSNDKDEEMGSKEAGEENGTDDNLEGLDGADDAMNVNNDDFEPSVQKQSGAQGQGADATNDEEDDNVGSFGNAQQERQEDSENVNEISRQEAKESLKQLGDSLKEFHRRHQDIKEASNTDDAMDEGPSANQRPDEFEHTDGANTDHDTQALGSANKDQTTAINEEMAIDDEAEDVNDDIQNPEELVAENEGPVEEKSEENVTPEQVQDRDSQGKATGSLLDEQETAANQNPVTNSELLELDRNDLDEIIDAIDQKVIIEEADAEPPRSLEEARKLWRKSEIETADLAAGLGEQLRLILEPTLATKLRGDYKTGKRLNMKRIIPYIASQFRKDKIWLRRTKPSKRQYQIMIAVDDSKSMSESKSVNLAFQSICLVSKALTQLESGGLSIVKFGDTTQEVHQFDKPFGNDAGAKIFQWFDFQDTRTDVKKLVAESIRIFDRGRSLNNADLWQLQIIISDGVCEDHDTIERLVRRARDNKIMLVFVIVDGINSSESIMDMSQVKYVPDTFGNVQLKVERYLDTFPFEFYVLVRDISELPEMLSVILRQYFSELASA
ncbi:LAME_0G07998g1_1 [Lachancea meyersii CBS 8951]|uniref:Midasin n=1 Tax=Lachancea meyersii CBS 8951 TaxID=1266667 RepID=A0A1G4K8A5_9SACH|nr:LAME_0G07998g1_1 [Lachancea meyersii CBS 8951]